MDGCKLFVRSGDIGDSKSRLSSSYLRMLSSAVILGIRQGTRNKSIDMTILLASTVAPHKLDEGYTTKWLTSVPAGAAVFLAAEIDRRGWTHYLDRAPELGLALDRLKAIVWTFTIDKAPLAPGSTEVTTPDRLVRICTGRNLAIDLAIWTRCSHILYVDTDVEIPIDALENLLEVDRPLVFGHIPSYCLSGPLAAGLPGRCQWHWSSAGFCLVRRDVFRHVRWGHDPDDGDGKTDDPTFARDVELMGKALGRDWRPVTRHDVVGKHWPEVILPLEKRNVDRLLR